MTVGERIREYRLEKGITQEMLANELYVSTQAVSKWERSISLPDVTLIVKISHILGVSCDALLMDNCDNLNRELNEAIKKAQHICTDDYKKYKKVVDV